MEDRSPSAAALAALHPIAVSAQEQASEGLNAIIVTARQRGQNLQTVPLSTALLEPQARTNHQIHDGRGLQAAVPTIVLRPPPGTQGSICLFIRGRGQDAASFARVPGFAFHIRDVCIAREAEALKIIRSKPAFENVVAASRGGCGCQR